MAARTGVPTMYKVAVRLCGLLATYQAIIVALYPTNTALLAALAAANAACSTLAVELKQVKAYGD